MMQRYLYDSANFEYICLVECQQSPINPLEFFYPDNSTDQAPPLCKDFEAAIFNVAVNCWEIIPDYRGETVYSIEDQSELQIGELGSIPVGYTLLKPASALDEWKGDQWEINYAKQLVQLVDGKVNQLVQNCDAAVFNLNKKYPDVEKDTFLKQEHEASLYSQWFNADDDDKDEPLVPFIRSIADQRGITVISLCNKILRRAENMNTAACCICAQRQKKHEEINKIKRDSQLCDSDKCTALEALDVSIHIKEHK